MAKVTLSTITSIFTAEGLAALNSNFTALADEFETVVSRDGQSPSALTTSLDANSQRIINLQSPVAASDAATKAYVDSSSGGVLSFPQLAPDGTVLAPSYSFQSASTTGILRDASDSSLVISVGNREVTAFRPTGEVSLGQFDNGSTVEEALRVIPVDNQVNRLEVRGSIVGEFPNFKAVGDDTNIGMIFRTKGTGKVQVSEDGASEVNVVLQTDLLDENIGAGSSATNYTPTGPTVEGHLAGIDTAFGAVGGGGVSWGAIIGTLSNQTDLQAALDAKATTSHTHVVADITDKGAWIVKPNKRELVEGVTSRDVTQAELDEGKVLFVPTTGGNATITVPDTLTVDVNSVYIFHIFKPNAANSISIAVGAGFTDKTGSITLTNEDAIMEVQVSRGSGATVTVRAAKGRYGV